MSGAGRESGLTGGGTVQANGLTWRGLGLCVVAVVAFFGALLPYGLMFHPVLGLVSFWLGWGCLVGFTWTTVAAAKGARDMRRVGWHIGACLVFLLAMVCGLWEPRDPERGILGMVGRGLLSVAIIAMMVRCVWGCPRLPWRVRRAASAATVAALIGVSFLSLAGPMASLRGGFHSPLAEVRWAVWLTLLGVVCLGAVVVPWVVDAVVRSNPVLAKKRPEVEPRGVIASSTKWLMTGAVIVVVGLLAALVFFMPGTGGVPDGELISAPEGGNIMIERHETISR